MKKIFVAVLSFAIIFVALNFSACAQDPETAESERITELTGQIDDLREKLDFLLAVDWDADYYDGAVFIHIKSEYANKIYTKIDFPGIEIYELIRVSNDLYIVGIENPGKKEIIRTAVKLYDLDFIEEVELDYGDAGCV